ncbi:MAG: hypothetical protein R3F11_17835 [Verrucomicrobiales bacterium]
MKALDADVGVGAEVMGVLDAADARRLLFVVLGVADRRFSSASPPMLISVSMNLPSAKLDRPRALFLDRPAAAPLWRIA